MDKPFKYDLVKVEWFDSYGCHSSWLETRDLAKKAGPHVCFSVGWLIEDNQDVIVIVPHLSPANDEIDAEEQGSGDMTIPKVSIISREILI